MIRLNKPAVDISVYVAEVVAERQNGVNAAFFAEIEVEWIQRCQAYDEHAGDAVLLPKWPEAVARATSFKTLYGSPAEDAAHAPLLRLLRDRTLTLCPMCGEGGTPNTLDHYLPKQDYPDFAILPLNLIPACDICQGHKLTRYVGPDGRLFLHPYYDAFLEGEVAELVIHPPFNAPTPELRCHSNVAEEHLALVARHLKELQLHARFKSSFRKEYIRVLRHARRMRERARDVEDAFSDLRDHAADRSINSWEHILYASVLENRALLDYLSTSPLPNYL
jgi:hypothetical protein